MDILNMEAANTSETTSPVSRTAAAIDEFVYAISHDLRGPLLNFQGFLRRLSGACQGLQSQVEKWDLTADQRQSWNQALEQKVWPSLQVLERNARRMDRLLAALLELSRAGREPPRFQRVVITDLIRGLAEEFRAAAAEKKAALTMEPVADVWADSGRLEQIFRHLLSNAFKFLSPEREGEVIVGGAKDHSGVICWVKDNGIGIKPQDQDRIFLPFGRLQEIEAPGEGIGLATARKLMEQQGGRIWVESTHRQGSTFYLSFPAERPAGGT